MRGWVCRLQLLLVLASAEIRVSESRGTRGYSFLSQIWDSPNLEGQAPVIYIPQEQGGPVIPPGTGFPFRRLLRLAGLRWRYSIPPPHGITHNWITRLRYVAPARTTKKTSLPLMRVPSFRGKQHVHRAVDVCMRFPLSHACYIYRPSHPLRLPCPCARYTRMWRKVRMVLLITYS
jgi:hypothetical protein